VSANDLLIYREGVDDAASRRLVWFDRNGKASEPIGPPIRSANIQLSPDGTRVAYAEAASDVSEDIWVYSLTSGVKTRLTTHPSADHGVVWSSDGRKVYFDSHRDGLPGVYERVADGAQPERRVIPPESGMSHAPRAVSPDGRYLLFAKSPTASAPWTLWLQPLPAGSAAAAAYAPTRFDQGGPAVSPDGRWLAYCSNESGRYEVFVQPLINPATGKWQVSTNGGCAPRWGKSGRELYYLADDGNLVSLTINSGATFATGPAVTLFKTPFGVGTIAPPYDTRDGERFLVSLPTSNPDAQPMSVLVNWPAMLKASTGR
jgi:Tol biopolymer transport system component